MDKFDRRRAIRRRVHRIAGALQTAGEKIGDSLFVFDHQNAHLLYFTPCGGRQLPKIAGSSMKRMVD
jgi:hypothetical protein